MPIASIQGQTRTIISLFPTLFLPLLLLSIFPISDTWAVVTRMLILGLAILFMRTQLTHPIVILLTGWLFLATLWSVNSSQSFAATLSYSSYLLIYILFRSQRFHENTLRWGLRLLIASAIGLSVYGLYQIFYGYADYFRMLETTAESLLPAPRAVMREWLTALSGRAFSRFALPSQFAMYLLMLFPLHGVLLRHERRLALRLLLGGGLILNGILFIYTKSFGAWLTLCGMLACGIILFLVRHQAITWRQTLAGSVLSIAIVLGITYLIGIWRGQHLWDLQGNNPLWFRLLNWRTAVSMWRDHVFLGTGLSTFGILYPNYMPPGANESNYAHNSYLQIGVEYGMIGLLLILWLVMCWGSMAFTMLKRHPFPSIQKTSSSSSSASTFFTDVRYASALGGLAFLLHNIIDFDLYVFPLGMLGMALLALALNPNELARYSQLQTRTSRWVTVCVGCGLLVVGILDWQQTAARQQYENARMHIQAQRYEEAAEAAHQTLSIWPTQPAHQALAGSIALYQQHAAEAQQYFQTAVQAEPQTPWFHAGLAEAYLAESNLGLAYVESRRAAELFPQKPEYAQRTRDIQDALPAF